MTTAVDTQPRVGLYQRQSYAPNANELAVIRQEQINRETCDRRGWANIVDVFTDNDRSATNGKRREDYERMMAAINGGRLDVIVAYNLDRLNREPVQYEELLAATVLNNVTIVTTEGEFDPTNDTNTMIGRITMAVAKFEGDRKARRQKDANKQRADAGRAWWPSRPFGYTMPKRGDKHGEWVAPQLVRREADAIAKAYDDVRAGKSLKEVARQWNQAGLLTPKGNQWNGMAVRALLLNPRNAALRTYQPDKAQPPEIVGNADWPAIISEGVWRGVRAMLTDRARLTPGAGFHTGRKHLLSGIATCSVCGGTLTSAPAPRPGGSVRYACKSAGCMKTKRSAADVDAWVIGHIVDRLADPENVEALTRRRDIDTADLAARLTEIEGDRKTAAKMIGAKQLTLSQLGVMNADWDAEVADIDAQMRDAARYAVLHRFIGADDVAAVFDDLSLDEQRAVVRLLVSVTVKPGQAPRRPFDNRLVVVDPLT
jgi:DNA invertase Pin-like site-specific DNA recombinase